MRIDTLGIEAFIAIAEQGNFGKAAKQLHITQTALSRRLQNLESLLGVRLVERTTRSVALTRLGSEFLPQSRRLMADLAAALQELHETGKAQRGDVSIACVPTVGVHYLPRVIQAYSARFPQNRIKILDHASAAVAEAVRRREAEFGIHVAGPHDPELASEPLLEDRFVLICRRDHALARRRRLTWKQLEPYPLVFVGAVSGNRPLLDAALGPRNLRLSAYCEVQHSSTAVGLVAAGAAPAIVPSLAVPDWARPALAVVPLTEPVVSRSLAIISRRSGSLSPAAQALYDMIRERR